MSSSEVVLYGCGDVTFGKGNPEFLLSKVEPVFKKGDINYGHLETSFSDRGAPQRTHGFIGAGVKGVDPAKNISGFTFAGFHVVSYASNHTLDWGEEPAIDTLEALKKNGIAVCGVGYNIEEARKPAIVERKGAKVAFLDYCSTLPEGWEATSNKLGCAPMRVDTLYQTLDGQPGMPPKVLTFTRKEDLEAMREDIKKAKEQADVVVMAIHWGVHMVPAVLSMYQKEVAYAAIDAGADLILGGHAHMLKSIEVYKGKAIFYSLGNFVSYRPISLKLSAESKMKDGVRCYPIREMNYYVDPEYAAYNWPADSRKTLIVKGTIQDKKLAKVSFLPCMINKEAQPEVTPRSDKRASEVLEYVEWCNKDQDIDTKFSWEGDEVVVHV